MNFSSRKKRLVQLRLQVRMTTWFLALSALGLVLQAFLLRRSLAATAAKGDGSAEQLMESLPTLLGVNFFVTLCVLVPVMALVGTFLTHRVAGPATRMERHLREWMAGEAEGPCQLRRGDDLHGLCALLNEALAIADEQADAKTDEKAAEEHPALDAA